MMIRTGQGLGVFDVQLFLPGLCLTLGALNGYAHCIKMVAQGAHHVLFFGGLKNMIIFVVGADRCQITKPAF